MLRRQCALVLVGVLALCGRAYAQAEAGAGQLQIGVATGGGVFFLDAGSGVSRFGGYAVGATVTFNVSPRVGIEGDLGFAIGSHQDLTLPAGTLTDRKTPDLLNYNGTIIYSPMGVHHRVFPYTAFGLGGLTMMNVPDTAALGLTTARSFLTGNLGGGVNWFPARHLGFRGDYRFLLVNNGGDAPVLLGPNAVSYGHRLYGALILTY